MYNKNIWKRLYKTEAGWGGIIRPWEVFIHRTKADFIDEVLGVYTHSMETIYLSLRAQVAVGTFFMKSSVLKTVYRTAEIINIFETFGTH